MPKIAVLTISDGVTAGTREDLSGRLAVEMLEEALEPELVEAAAIPDDRDRIEETLIRWSDQDRFDLIITSGGTGISPRDSTPQSTLAVVDYEVPGLAEMMRITSLQKTPMKNKATVRPRTTWASSGHRDQT